MSTFAERITSSGLSIETLLFERAQASPHAAAILGLGRDPLSFARLQAEVDRTRESLRRLGVRRGDRVAMVLPNGPEAAVCCFAVSCAATSAPLNPAYLAAEFDFYLSDLQPKILIVHAALDSPAVAVAEARGIRVLRLTAQPAEPAGVFQLTGDPVAPAVRDEEPAHADHVALVLHTSGSTSRPKIVPLTQANLYHSARNIARSLALSAEDRCLNVMPLFHIHGLIGCVLSSWSAGAAVVCTPGFQAPHFFEWLAEFEPTWYSAVPTMHQAILSQIALGRAMKPGGAPGSRLRFIRSASSALPPKVWEETERAFGVPMVEAYGMTEASHQMAVNPLPPGERKPGSVGRAAGCEIAILDPSGAPQPAGTAGDIAIRGANVTAGYENNPDANQACFVGEGGLANRWFLTGDLGRLDEDGYLFLTGRSKEIINRGGEKIAPREVDEALLEHPAVAAAMAFALPDARLGEDVAAAVVFRANCAVSEMELREHTAARLADFKVPRRIVFLDELPKGPTGKPQRIGLAERLGLSNLEAPAAEQRSYVAPRTDTERALASIWQEVLRYAPVGIQDDFLGLGGDSILGTQIATRVRQHLHVVLPLFRLFGSPTIEALAAWVDTAPRESAEGEAPIPPVARTDFPALSFAQQRMWFLVQFEDSTPAYVIPTALRLRGPLRTELLKAALQRVVDRHEVLRTTFAIRDGLPVARIASEARLDVAVLDCPGIPESEREATAQRLAVVEVQSPLDLARDLPIRSRIVRFAADDHLLLITVHHIASDGWSKSVLFREMEQFYVAALDGREPDLAPLTIQYADYAHWLRAQMEGEHGEKLLEYWMKRIAGAPGLLELPLDRPRPARQTFDSSVERSVLSAGLTGGLRSFGRAESVTLYMTLLAAFQTLLSRYSGATDICVGTPIAHRLRPETESLIGYFVNTLVMRTELSGDPTFRELLGRVRETALGAYEHQDMPLEKLIEALQPARSLSYTPVFQVLFQLRNFPEIVTRLEGLDVSTVAYDPGTAQFELILEITEQDDGLACVLTYNSGLFDQSTARRMLGHYETLLEAIVKDPDTHLSALPLLTGGERRELLIERNATAMDYPRIPAVGLFEQQAARTPDAIAVCDDSQRWSYADLNARANAVAQRLCNCGVKPRDLVAIYVGRSVEMVAGLLGIWKSGAAYVPLDSAYPKDRLAYILEDAGVTALLTEESLRGSLPDAGIPVVTLEECRLSADGAAARPVEASGEDLAYVIYTSGSTGKPKGVAIRHRSVTNLLLTMQHGLEFSERETQLAVTTICFDISVSELFVPLISGARVVIASQQTMADGELLGKALETSAATIMQATPSSWQMLLDAGWTGPRPGSPLKIVAGGEALPKALAGKLAAFGRTWNDYGPTETTVVSTLAEIRAGDGPVPIGRPLANTRVYVLDQNRQLVPSFVPGELYIAGDGLAAGYWRRDDLTDERFVPDPFVEERGARMYRTGDLVRWLPSGELQFLRRIDTQVKLRGFRIELGEIESVLNGHPDVRAAAAKVIDPDQPEARLAVFYTTHSGRAIENDELRAWARAKLPDYMTPGILVAVPELPQTPNGKVDRAALSVAGMQERVPAQSATPGDFSETALLAIWQQVLRSGPIGIHDDFFALGGHSLLGARLLSRVERAFGVKLTLSTFFEAPTVAQMAALLRDRPVAGGSRVIPIRAGDDRPPLYILHAGPIFRSLMLAMPPRAGIAGVSLPADAELLRMDTLEQIAAHEAAVLLEAQAEGPFAIGGWCMDGVLAYEIGRQIQARRGTAPLLILFDSFNPARGPGQGADIGQRLRYLADKVREQGWRQGAKRLRESLQWWRKRRARTQDADRLAYAVSRYRPQRYDGPVLVFRPVDRPAGAFKDCAHGWRELIPRLEVADVPGDHMVMLNDPGVQVIAARIAAKMDEEFTGGLKSAAG